MIINLIGQPGSGKTTISKLLQLEIPKSISIDGDEIRDIFNNKDYSEVGRRKNIQNAYNIALFLEKKGFNPIISLVSPYRDLREWLKEQTEVFEFYIYTSDIRGREKFFVENYEIPIDNYTSIDTTNKEPSDVVENQIKDIIRYETSKDKV
jgi:adenylylsulfate kinase-like enzyme